MSPRTPEARQEAVDMELSHYRMALDAFLFRGRGWGSMGSRSSSAKWISTRRFDAFAEPSVSSATRREPARPTQFRRDRSMPRATRRQRRRSATKRESDGATFFAAEEFLTNSVRALVVAAHAVETAL